MGKQQIRARKEPSPGKKVSEVEAAYVVESYLIEKHFTKALVGFHADAASILSSLKNAPPAVRSLTTILNDFVTLRINQQTLQEENARLEQCVKEAQQVLQQERSRMNSFVQGVHESLAVFQSGCGSPSTLALPSMSTSPTNSAAIFQVGHSTPPGAGMDLAKTPCSVRVTNSGSASNKRKISLNKIPHEVPRDGSPTTKSATAKKARPGRQVSGSLPDGPPSSPWMCGMVRKNSVNMVRPVLPMPGYQEIHFSTRGSKIPQPGRSMPSSRDSTHLTSPPAISSEGTASKISASPSHHTGNRPISPSAAPPTTCSEHSKKTCFDKGQAFGQGLKTPPRVSSSVIPPAMVPVQSQPPEDNIHVDSSDMSPEDTKRCIAYSDREEQYSQQAGEDRTANEATALNSDSSSEASPESSHSDGREEFHFKKAPSKTMRPLDFSNSAIIPVVVGSPASQISPPTMSPPPSECEDTSAGAQIGDNSEHSTADLFLIDDILASLDDASFSSLVGDMPGADEITMNDLVSNSQTYGDVDFSNIHIVTNRSSMGEDSFGFQCFTEAANPMVSLEPAGDELLKPDGCESNGVPSTIVTDSTCSPQQQQQQQHVGILSERDPNRTVSEHRTKKCSSFPSKHSSKRETSKGKYAFGQENIPASDFIQVMDEART